MTAWDVHGEFEIGGGGVWRILACMLKSLSRDLPVPPSSLLIALSPSVLVMGAHTDPQKP